MDRVCVLIINYLNYKETLRYVRNLQMQKGVALSILVVDNHSPNEAQAVLSRELSNFPDTKLLQSGYNGGYAFGVNTGLRYLANKAVDFVLISNNDVWLDDEYLIRNLIGEYYRLPNPAFIAPAMYVGEREDQKHQAWKIPRLVDDLLASLRILYGLGRVLGISNRYDFPADTRQTEAVDCLSGSFFMGPKAVFFRLGLWDEHTFLYVEESILGWKVKKEGLQNYLARSLQFHHALGGTTRELHSLAQLQRYWLESTIYFQHTYRSVPLRRLTLLRILFYLWLVETYAIECFRKLLPPVRR